MTINIETQVGGDTSEKKPYRVRCGSCEHVWTAAYLPMVAVKAARLLMGLRCPMCAEGAGKIFMAKKGT